MEKFEKNKLTIRKACSGDVVAILEMVQELADFEKLGDEMIATEADYQESLFGEKPAAEALVAELHGALIGYAIFFSTFIGRAGLWLEDLYVKPEFRRLGIGKKLLKAGGEMARARNAGRYEWCVLDWNQNAIDLYKQMGGDIMEEWRIVRLNRNAIEALPEK